MAEQPHARQGLRFDQRVRIVLANTLLAAVSELVLRKISSYRGERQVLLCRRMGADRKLADELSVRRVLQVIHLEKALHHLAVVPALDSSFVAAKSCPLPHSVAATRSPRAAMRRISVSHSRCSLVLEMSGIHHWLEPIVSIQSRSPLLAVAVEDSGPVEVAGLLDRRGRVHGP